jgi:ubiquinone/menaquinone biosynthesis C-methylase UbiE
MNEIFYEMFKDMPRQGPGKPEYTKKALSFCSFPDNPIILDIGCGTGAQTIALAENINCKITAVDNHMPFLEELNKKAKRLSLDSTIHTFHGDMNHLAFKEKFDLIWSEGAIYIMGFEKGLRELKKFLKPKGFIAISEVAWIKENPPKEAVLFWKKEYPAMKDISSNIEVIQSAGYRLINHFIMPQDAWDEFYSAFKIITNKMRKKYKNNKQAERVIEMITKEIEAYEKFSDYYGYVFYIMKN